MKHINFTVDVHCIVPSWVPSLKELDKYWPPIYRLYVNNDLITERQWQWDNDQKLVEDIWVHNVGIEYVAHLEPILLIPAQAKFSIANVQAKNCTHFKIVNAGSSRISFTIS